MSLLVKKKKIDWRQFLKVHGIESTFYNVEILSEDFEQAKCQWGHQIDRAFPVLKARSGSKGLKCFH